MATENDPFEEWLEKRINELDTVTFVFTIPPRPGMQELHGDCTILEKSSSMLLIEFFDGEAWWVAREIISGVAHPDQDEEFARRIGTEIGITDRRRKKSKKE